MKTLFLVLAMLAAALPAYAEGDRLTPLAALNDADHKRVVSEAIGRPFHIHVRPPLNYEETEQLYPTVYLLDGDVLFPLLGAYHVLLNIDTNVPDAIIVGISYGGFGAENGNYRSADYTVPPFPDDYLAGLPGSDGAPAFHAFLKDEVIPHIEKTYRADPERRILVGQSRGGHFALYSAMADPDLFWGRIASNPPLSPNRDFFLRDIAPSAQMGSSLFVSSAERDFPKIRQDAIDLFAHFKSQDALPWRLKTTTVAGETHAAGIVNVYRAGMRWLFPTSEATPSESGDNH
ncbi:MAG: alpha/beta hydrolase-fold protein [Pseudomonadota bacterium]